MPNILNILAGLPIGSFVAKENLGDNPFDIEVRLMNAKRHLQPRLFITVSKHLVRIK